MTKYPNDPYRAEREEAYLEGYSAGLVGRSVDSLGLAVVILALSDLVAAVGKLPENGVGTVQGDELNKAYSHAVDLLRQLRVKKLRATNGAPL